MGSTSGKLRLVMVGVSAAALMQAPAAFAEDGARADQAQAGAAPADADDGLHDIVVTAQKRSENIRDVPISITALSSSDIEKAGVKNIVDLTAVVPGLKMDRVGGVILPAIRGVTTLTTTGGVEPNVSTYVDNIYIGGSAGTIQQLPDISRVDVLKGPQGTLFGRNSTGGAIQIFTRDPNMDKLGGQVSVDYGRFNDLVFKGFASAPIVPGKLAVSISGYRETADNYNHNLTPNVPIDRTDNYTLRAKILFTPTDSTRILITGMVSKQSDPSTLLFSPINGITIAKGVPGAIYPTKPFDVASNLPLPSLAYGKMASIELTQKTGLGDLTISASARRQNNALSRTTATAFAFPTPYTGVNYTISGIDSAEQAEIDFASRKFGGFSFVVGANYYHNNSGGDPSQIVTSTPSSSSAITAYGGQTSKTYAVFGEATLQLTDKLSVVGGLRYTNERRGVFGSILPGVLDKGQGNYYEFASKRFPSVTQKVALRYEVSRNTNAYFTYSTGFRSGNFNSFDVPFGNVTPASCAAANATRPGSCATPVPVKPEKITAYEVGVKSAPTSWLRFDAALFYYKLSEIQILSFSNVCVTAPCPPNPTTPLGKLSNAAESSIYGAEADVSVRMTKELSVQAAVSLLNATFSSYENAVWNVPAPGGLGLVQTPIQSATGKEMPRAPKATLTVSATYTKDLPAGEISLSANGYATERVYFDIGNVFYQPSYATLGLRASFSPSAVPGLTASVWGNNVTNRTIILSTFLNAYGALASYAAPATYGATLSYKF